MSEPQWQRTTEIRWRPSVHREIPGVVMESGDWMVLEQLWTRAEWTEVVEGSPRFHSRGEDWREIPVVE